MVDAAGEAFTACFALGNWYLRLVCDRLSQQWVLTDGMGGPVNSTLVYLLYLYRQAFVFFRMGYASAMAWILFLIILMLTLIQFRTAHFWVYYEVER